jgi:cystathionine beta-synthase
VSEAPEGEAIEAIVGSVNEKSLLDRAYRDPTVVQRTVGEVMDKPLPTIDAPASLDNAFALLSNGVPAIVVIDQGRAAGVVTKLDLLEYLAHRSAGKRGA